MEIDLKGISAAAAVVVTILITFVTYADQDKREGTVKVVMFGLMLAMCILCVLHVCYGVYWFRKARECKYKLADLNEPRQATLAEIGRYRIAERRIRSLSSEAEIVLRAILGQAGTAEELTSRTKGCGNLSKALDELALDHLIERNKENVFTANPCLIEDLNEALGITPLVERRKLA